MAKKIEITYNGKNYTLEYTLETVKQMERAGFDIDKIADAPATSLETLFTGAFLENHGRAIKDKIPAKIIKGGLPKTMLPALVEMYNEVMECLLYDEDNADEETEKNLKWEKNF